MTRKNTISGLEGSTSVVFSQPFVLPFRLPFKQPTQTKRGQHCVASCMSWEGMQLARGGSTRLSFLYLAGSLLLGLIAATCGLALGGGL